ncbi:MAG: hypothetical protein JSU05_08385 [Bacteroidetes bacterium]|nr:hypothetical protein [Bacteroidota bacterium]
MDKVTFRQHLHEATKALVDFTKTLCYNDLADNYKYRITPNSRTVDKKDNHLTESEIAVLHIWNKYENKILTADQIVDLLHHDNRVPVWIDTTIYEARHNLTVIDLFCSRRLRDDNELYHQGQIMPFHLLVPIPPDHQKNTQDCTFDINWKKRLDDKKKSKTLLTQFKTLLRFYAADGVVS